MNLSYLAETWQNPPPRAIPRSDQLVATTPAETRILERRLDKQTLEYSGQLAYLLAKTYVQSANQTTHDNQLALTIHPLAVNPSKIAFAANTTVARYFGL